jgi:hypothetical protein
VFSQDASYQDVFSQDASYQDVSYQDVFSQDVSYQDVFSQDVFSQDVSYQDVSCRDGPHGRPFVTHVTHTADFERHRTRRKRRRFGASSICDNGTSCAPSTAMAAPRRSTDGQQLP